MLKINEKYYKKITTEPFEIQEIENKKIELHSLNQNAFYKQFIGGDRFFFWATADGLTYRLVIEDGFYQVMKPLYQKNTNAVWITYYENTEKVRKRIFTKIVLPVLVLYVVATFILFQLPALSDFLPVILIITLAMVFVGSRFLTSALRKRFMEENQKSVERIRKIIGKKEFERLIDAQEDYRKEFFKDENTNIEENKDEAVLLEEKNDNNINEEKNE